MPKKVTPSKKLARKVRKQHSLKQRRIKRMREVSEQLVQLTEEELKEKITGEDGVTKTGVLSEEEREARFLYLQKLIFRGLSTIAIARVLQLTPARVSELKRDLIARTRLNVQGLDFHAFLGTSMAFYQDIMSSMMLKASNSNRSPMEQIAAQRTALQAHNDLQSYLKGIGFYDLPTAKAAMGQVIGHVTTSAVGSGGGEEDVQKHVDAALARLNAVDAEEVPDTDG